MYIQLITSRKKTGVWINVSVNTRLSLTSYPKIEGNQTDTDVQDLIAHNPRTAGQTKRKEVIGTHQIDQYTDKTFFFI